MNYLQPHELPDDYSGPYGLERILLPTLKEEYKRYIHFESNPATKTQDAYAWILVGESFKKEKPTRRTCQRQKVVEISKLQVQAKEDPKNWLKKDSDCQWDENAFEILTTNSKVIAFLQEFYGRLMGNRPGPATIWRGGSGGNPFARDGIVLCLPEFLEQEEKEGMKQSEKSMHELYKNARATGIFEKIPKTRYYALKPGTLLKSRKNGPIQTKHSIMFFLNPVDQKRENFGWFTVEELEAWMGNKGPIIKQEKNI